MKTDDLIASLADDGPAIQARPLAMLAAWSLGAFAACLVLLALVLGSPIFFAGEAPAALPFSKLLFPLGLALSGALAIGAAGIPGRSPLWPVIAIVGIFAATGIAVAVEMGRIDPAWPGRTWARCVTAILLLSPIAFIGTCFTLRRLAPTRLRLAGALAGLFSAAVGATAYVFWCPETAVTFLLAWYGGPILLCALAGAAIGPRLLRW